eukprot:6630645-Lingulodinium_polyedra.AAC.1
MMRPDGNTVGTGASPRGVQRCSPLGPLKSHESSMGTFQSPAANQGAAPRPMPRSATASCSCALRFGANW